MHLSSLYIQCSSKNPVIAALDTSSRPEDQVTTQMVGMVRQCCKPDQPHFQAHHELCP